MQPIQAIQSNPSTPGPVHFGHLGAVLLAAVFLVGATWLRNPQLFSVFKNNSAAQTAAAANAPKYYSYVAPADDQQPEVLGASTDASSQDTGPMVIGDDGSVQPVDMGQVLGASTQGVTVNYSDVQVNAVPDSTAAVTKYFTDAEGVESGAVNQTDLASALTSQDQNQINQQAVKITAVVTALQKLPVPQSLVKLQQMKIVQYNSAIALLQNFTQSDQNPDLVTQNLQQFIKSQQDLDTENMTVAEEYPTLDPDAALYVNSDGTPLPTPTPLPTDSGTLGTTGDSPDNSASLFDASTAGQ